MAKVKVESVGSDSGNAYLNLHEDFHGVGGWRFLGELAGPVFFVVQPGSKAHLLCCDDWDAAVMWFSQNATDDMQVSQLTKSGLVVVEDVHGLLFSKVT